ncbi:hypothetical protein ORS3428_29405 [Mesorhizobium sp. ORS 3428]|nr:hypothetical protein ORS3428_29800 [Mesorhizobium sp. ORS 3428]OHV90177.1 hypothetical protein ORS3428_29405 [Mesorhizobium sp. ORS 3428]
MEALRMGWRSRKAKPDAARKLQRDLMKLERRYEADHAFRNSSCDLGQGMRNVDVGIRASVEPS